MNTIEEALRRAKIRIRYHGWRRTADPAASGWTIREAIVGRKPTLIPEHELQAVLAVSEAIGVPSEELDAWNDAPYRNLKEVLKALARARTGLARATITDASPPEAPIPVEVSVPLGLMEAAEGDSPLSEETDLEEVIKDHLRGN